MGRRVRRPILFVAVCGLAMAGCTNNSGVTPSAVPSGPEWRYANGVLYHTPHVMLPASMAPRGAQPNVLFSYYGGRVLTDPKVYLIFWGYKRYGDPDKVKPLLTLFAKHMGGSGHNDIYTQYYQSQAGVTTYITNAKGQLAGVWDDESNPVPTSPSQAQVAAEALNGLNHFGFDRNGSYVVATPHGHNTPGFGQSFCGYHDSAWSGRNIYSFTNLPYIPDANPQHNCGANWIKAPADEDGVDEGVTIVEGHEYGESITDPIAAEGWYNKTEGEIGDICAWADIENVAFGNRKYTSQPMFSNATQSCVQTY